MRPLISLLVFVGACAQTDALRTREAEGSACAISVADPLGEPVEDMSTTVDRTAPTGSTVVSVRSKDSTPICEVDAALSALQLIQPQDTEA